MSTTILNRESTTYGTTVEMGLIQCCNCGVPFAIPQQLKNEFLDDSTKSFYCPHGHSQHYGNGEKQRLKNLLLKRENELAQVTTAKIQMENQLKKVANGQCPCCGKTFKHLARHMKNKHQQ